MDENTTSFPNFIHKIWPSQKPREPIIQANPTHGSSAAEYSRRFNNLGDLFAVVDKKKELLGYSPSVLDIMSDLTAIKSLKVSGGVAIELGKEDGQFDYEENNLHQLNGDIRRKKTFVKLDKIMKKNGFEKGFDIIMWSGVGGMERLTDNPNIYFFLLQQFYQRLSNNSGLIFSEIPESSSYIIREWVRFIEENYKDKIEVKLKQSPTLGRKHNYILAIIKQPEAPDTLPCNFTVVNIDKLYKRGLFNKGGVLRDGEAPGLIEKEIEE